LDFDFFSPALLDDELETRTHVAKVGRSSIALEIDIQNLRNDLQVAQARQVVACVDRKTLESCPLPEELAQAFRRCLVGSE